MMEWISELRELGESLTGIGMWTVALFGLKTVLFYLFWFYMVWKITASAKRAGRVFREKNDTELDYLKNMEEIKSSLNTFLQNQNYQITNHMGCQVQTIKSAIELYEKEKETR